MEIRAECNGRPRLTPHAQNLSWNELQTRSFRSFAVKYIAALDEHPLTEPSECHYTTIIPRRALFAQINLHTFHPHTPQQIIWKISQLPVVPLPSSGASTTTVFLLLKCNKFSNFPFRSVMRKIRKLT